MLAALKAFFSFGTVADTATNIINKIAGTDWLPQQKADFLLEYMKVTQHQSPARRAIALIIVFMWALLALSWLVSNALGRFYYEGTLNAGTVFAADISAFMSLNINEGFALILAFYFGVQGIVALKK